MTPDDLSSVTAVVTLQELRLLRAARSRALPWAPEPTGPFYSSRWIVWARSHWRGKWEGKIS